VPFSSYAGFDRLLLVLAGALALEIGGRLLALESRECCRFGGEAAVTASPAARCLVFKMCLQHVSSGK
jgi:environmental stress-induced protein Ves